MIWSRSSLVVVFTGLIYGNIALIFASPLITTGSDNVLMPRAQDKDLQTPERILDATASSNITTLSPQAHDQQDRHSLLPAPPSSNSSSPALIPIDNDQPYMYRFCRRSDHAGCMLDVGCDFVKFVWAPIGAFVWFARQMQRARIDFTSLSGSYMIIVCRGLQEKLDKELGELLYRPPCADGLSDEDEDDNTQPTRRRLEMSDKL